MSADDRRVVANRLATHQRLGQTGAMRNRGRLGGSSPGHAFVIGIQGSVWQGYFLTPGSPFTDRCAKNLTPPRVLADLHRVAQAMTCDHGRETVVRTGEAPSLGRKADRIASRARFGGSPVGTDALTGVVTALEGTATPVEMAEQSHSSWTALPDFLWPSAPKVKLFAQRSVAQAKMSGQSLKWFVVSAVDRLVREVPGWGLEPQTCGL